MMRTDLVTTTLIPPLRNPVRTASKMEIITHRQQSHMKLLVQAALFPYLEFFGDYNLLFHSEIMGTCGAVVGACIC
jgi:hypothetical protein